MKSASELDTDRMISLSGRILSSIEEWHREAGEHVKGDALIDAELTAASFGILMAGLAESTTEVDHLIKVMHQVTARSMGALLATGQIRQ